MPYIEGESRFLIFGNGWIGNLVKDLLESQGKTAIISEARTENREHVMSELRVHEPTRVINCAGARGTPNADWCEDHKIETMRSNVLGVMNVIDCSYLQDIHVTHFGSACIFDQDDAHPVEGSGFTEEDEPNWVGSWYSRSRNVSEKAISHYPNVLILRIRNPIAPDLHPKNLITKLMTYEKLLDMPGSGSVLPNLLPGAMILCEKGITGIYNFTSPGTFTNNEIMLLAKQYIRPDLKWQNFSLEDQTNALKAPRTNAKFDTTKAVTKLKEYGYEIKDSHAALEDVFIEMKKKGL